MRLKTRFSNFWKLGFSDIAWLLVEVPFGPCLRATRECTKYPGRPLANALRTPGPLRCGGCAKYPEGAGERRSRVR